MWLISIYVPYSRAEKILFYKKDMHKLLEYLAVEGKAADHFVVGMDANSAIDPSQDVHWEAYDPATRNTHLKEHSEIAMLFNAWMDTANFSDTWLA